MVYVRTPRWAVLAGCGGAHMPPNKSSGTTRRQIPSGDTSAPGPLPSNRDICAPATITLGQRAARAEDLESKQSSKGQTFFFCCCLNTSESESSQAQKPAREQLGRGFSTPLPRWTCNSTDSVTGAQTCLALQQSPLSAH